MKYCEAIQVFLQVITNPHHPYAECFVQPFSQPCPEDAYMEGQAEPRIAQNPIMADMITLNLKLEKAKTVLSVE